MYFRLWCLLCKCVLVCFDIQIVYRIDSIVVLFVEEFAEDVVTYLVHLVMSYIISFDWLSGTKCVSIRS